MDSDDVRKPGNERGFVDGLRTSLRADLADSGGATTGTSSRFHFSRKWLLGLVPVLLIGAGLMLLQTGVLRGGSTTVARNGDGTTEKPATVPEKIVSAVGGVTKKAATGLTSAKKQAGNVVGSVQDKASEVGNRERRTSPKRASKPVVKKPKPVDQPVTSKPRRIAGTKPGAAPRPLSNEREVENGDSLRRIAKQQYGDEMMWPLIWDYNMERARHAGQKMDDPDLIYPGWTFLIPGKENAKPALPAKLQKPAP
ncbi:MAG: LysM peptidoglycan-binding domain-containing protein [Chloroflexota bacterium]|nr:LysM peptidoglycan-binding domain-containing protein [Chloroflexota bacterium]